MITNDEYPTGTFDYTGIVRELSLAQSVGIKTIDLLVDPPKELRGAVNVRRRIIAEYGNTTVMFERMTNALKALKDHRSDLREVLDADIQKDPPIAMIVTPDGLRPAPGGALVDFGVQGGKEDGDE